LDRGKDKKAASGTQPDGSEASSEPRGIAPEAVVDYLRRHPDFLMQHPQLLGLLTPPEMQRGEGVIDMQHFMLQRLREELARAKLQHRALIATSRSNLSSQNRIHGAVLAIIGATSFEQLIQTVTTDLAVLLDVDAVTIAVESSAGALPRLPRQGVQMLPRGTVDELLGAERDVLLLGDTPGDAELFGSAAGLVRSQALLRLRVSEKTPAGLLCIGTRKPDKFHPGQGTELLCFLARALEISIAAWLDLAA
jgi:uncharacterized protein YigA (DUF484 family)